MRCKWGMDGLCWFCSRDVYICLYFGKRNKFQENGNLMRTMSVYFPVLPIRVYGILFGTQYWTLSIERDVTMKQFIILITLFTFPNNVNLINDNWSNKISMACDFHIIICPPLFKCVKIWSLLWRGTNILLNFNFT